MKISELIFQKKNRIQNHLAGEILYCDQKSESGKKSHYSKICILLSASNFYMAWALLRGPECSHHNTKNFKFKKIVFRGFIFVSSGGGRVPWAVRSLAQLSPGSARVP